MADGSITIDVDFPIGKLKSDAQLADQILNNVGKGAGKELDTNFREHAEKLKSISNETEQYVNDKLGKEVKTKLTADNSEVKEKVSATKDDLDELPKDKTTDLTANDNASGKIKHVGDEADNTSKKFHNLKDIIHGTFIGNLAAQGATMGLTAIRNGIRHVISEGMALNGATGKITAQFKAMGLSTRWTKRLVSQLGDLKVRFAATGVQISNVQRNMLNWSRIGRNGALQMTTALTEAAAQGRLTGDQYEQVSQAMMRVGSSGKVSLGTLGRIARVMPNIYSQLARGAGMSENHMKALLATGKVTTAQFQTWLARSSKNNRDAFKDYEHTQGGAANRMQKTWQKLEQTMTKPLFNLKSSGLNQMADLMSKPAVTKGAQLIGKGIQDIAKWGLQVLKAIGEHESDVSGIMTDIVKIAGALAKDVWEDFSAIVGDIARSLGLVHSNSSKSGSSLHTVREAMDGLAKNKNDIRLIAHAIELIALAKLANTANSLFHIKDGAHVAWNAVKGLAEGIKGIDNPQTLSGTEKAFYKLGGFIKQPKQSILNLASTFKDKLGSMADAAKTFGGKVTGIFSKLGDVTKGLFGKGTGAGKFNGMLQSLRSARQSGGLSTAGKIATGAAVAGIAVDSGADIYKAIKAKAGSRKQYEDIGSGAGKAIGGGIGLYFGGPLGAAIGAKIGGTVGKWAGNAAKDFQNGWNKKKPPKKFWSLENLGWSTHDMFKKVGKWGQGVAKSFQTGLKKDKSRIKSAWNSVTSSVGKANSAVKKNFSKFSSFLHKSIKKGADKAGKAFKKGWDYMYKHGSKGTKQIMRSTSKFAKNYVKINKRANDETRKNFASFSKRLKRNHGDLFKTIGQTTKEQLKIEKKRWSSNWKNIKSTASEIWKGIKSNTKGFYDDLNKKTHGGLGKVVSGFQSFGKKLASFWSGLFSGIKKTFDNVIGGISKTIGGLGSGIGKFFSGKLKVGSLHLASGTDWRRRYPVPAILNDGSDSPETGNREGIIDNRTGALGLLPPQQNLKRLLMPWEDVVSASDMAGFMGYRHYARGTTRLSGTKSGISGIANIRTLTRDLRDLERALKSVQKLSKIKLTAKGLSRVLKEVNSLNKTLRTITRLGSRAVKQYKTVSRELQRMSKQARNVYEVIRKNNFGKLIDREATEAVKSLKGDGNFAAQFKKLGEEFTKTSKNISTSFHKTWKDMFDDADKRFKTFSRENLRDLASFKNNFERGWKSIDTGVSRIYSKFWSEMRSSAGKGLNNVISVVNSGISKINGVIGSFGGNGHAISYAGHVHYATGTGVFNNARRPITKPTLAIVNDGNDSPETGNREVRWRPSTGQFDIFNGLNVPTILMPGDEIFSASEARDLGITKPMHYATGTGSLKALYDLSKKFNAHPSQTLDNYLNDDGISSRGGMRALANGLYKQVDSQAKDFWTTLWKMVSDKINDGDGPASGLLKAVEKYGEGHRYVWGAAGPSTFDCSGLVMYALKHAYGINYPHFSGAQYGMTQHISKANARMGDLVFWGTGGGEHVGVYAGGNRYFSAQSPSQGIHMNTLNSVVGYGAPKFGRVRGVNTHGTKSVKVKANSQLERYIRSVVGKGFWSTIQKIEDKYGESADGIAGKPTGDHSHWMKQAHIPERDWNMLNWIVTGESGWNPHARNPSSGTYGLGQMQSYNLHYYRRHGGLNNPIAQLKGIMDYIHDRYGSVAHAYAFRRSHGWYANGGFITSRTEATLGEGNGAEVVLPYGDPSKRERTLQLMQATIAQMQAQDGMTTKLSDKPQQTDMTVVNGAISEINKKFDQALEALGIITSKDETIQINNQVSDQTLSAVYKRFKKFDAQNLRRAGQNISGYQTF